MKQQPNGNPEVILFIDGEEFKVLSLHSFSGKFFWSTWSILRNSEATLLTSGEDKDGQSAQEQDLPVLGKRKHNTIEHLLCSRDWG